MIVSKKYKKGEIGEEKNNKDISEGKDPSKVSKRKLVVVTKMTNYGRDHTTLGRDDTEQHCFTCEEIWAIEKTFDDQAKIMKLETTYGERALT
jgi:hypothetical protein